MPGGRRNAKEKRMKVLHIIGGGDVGGGKVHVLSLVKELKNSIDVKLISLRPGSFADDARSMGIDVEVVKTGNIIADINRVAKIVREGGYQIIHCHGSKANMFALIVRRITGTPSVTTVHSDYRLDYMHNVFKKHTFGLINKIALRFMDYYIGVSDNFRQMLIERNFDPDSIFTLYNGIDFDESTQTYSRADFSRKYGLNLDESDIVVGILARLYPVKDINTLVEAARITCGKNHSVKYVIGGDGEDKKRLQRKVASLGIGNNVFFLGWIDNPGELMGNLDINVLTSLSESFPYSILEGAIYKKATISSDVGGIPALIEHGENGYLFKPGDSQKLAEYILELAADGGKRKTMGEKIYNKAFSKFSLKDMCKTQLDIYSAILEKEKTGTDGRHGYDAIISGYYGFKNIGDDAMLMAIINNLREYKCGIRVAVLSRDPSETRKVYGVHSIKRTDLANIFLAMRKAKLFIYGGGNLIQDKTSTRSLFYYLSTIWLAKLMGLKVMFYANGIGPLNKNINMKLTEKIMNQVNVITLRESISLRELERLHIDRPRVVVTADPAMAVEIDADTDAEDILLKEGISLPGPFVGFSVRPWEGLEAYAPIIARLADYMAEKYKIKPVFIPMHYPGDVYAAQEVAAGMKSKGFIVTDKYGVSQTLALVSKMEMLIGMRLHALIFAASLGIPMIGLSYEPKIDGFLQYIGQVSAGDVRRLEFENLKALADNVWNNRQAIANQLKKDSARFKEMARENARIAVELITQE